MVVITVGKRKTAIARCYIKDGKGRVIINGKRLEMYEPHYAKLRIMEPLVIAGEKYLSKIDIYVNVKGGGIFGRADAIRVAIAKGLVKYFDDEKLKMKLLEYDPFILKSDIRRKEQRKSPTSKARKQYTTAYR